MNVSLEQERIDIEKFRGSLTNSLNSLAQAIPQMAAAGGDPSDIIEKLAKLIDLRRNGKAVEDAVMEVFQKKEAPPAPPAQPEGAPAPTSPAQAAQEAAPGQPAGAPTPPQGSQQPSVQDILSRLGG
jgi:hypothetical protein